MVVMNRMLSLPLFLQSAWGASRKYWDTHSFEQPSYSRRVDESSCAVPETLPWFENFDKYKKGSEINGQGGWETFDFELGKGAIVSKAEWLSPHNSIAVEGTTDLVQAFSGATSGQWRLTAWQYLPEDFTGVTRFLMMNTYTYMVQSWSQEVIFNSTSDTVYDSDGNRELDLIKGRWVELRVEINLEADMQGFYYDDKFLFEKNWTQADPDQTIDGVTNIGAVNLWGGGTSADAGSVVYYDNFALVDVEGLLEHKRRKHLKFQQLESGDVKSYGKDHYDDVKTYGKDHYDDVKTYGKDHYDDVKTYGMDDKTYGKDHYDDVKTYSKDHYDDVKTYGKNHYDDVKSYGKDHYDDVKSYGKDHYDDVKTYGKDHYDDVKTYGKDHYDNVKTYGMDDKTYGKDHYGDVKTYGKDHYGDVKTYGKDHYGDVKTYGKDHYGMDIKSYGKDHQNGKKNDNNNKKLIYEPRLAKTNY